MYQWALVDECGTVRKYCSDLSETEIEDLLINHPEWKIMCV